MKKLFKKSAYKFAGLAVVLLLLCPLFLQAQTPRNKRVEKSFSAKEMVTMDHRYGPLTVKAAKDGKVSVSAEIAFKAQDDKDAQMVLDEFDISVKEGGSSLELVTNFEVSTWEENNSRIKLKFKNGKKVNNLKDLKIELVLYVPTLKKLSLKNKYDQIEIVDNLAGDLALDLYSGRLQVGNVGGQLELKTKYSKGEIGNFAGGQLDLYDSDIDFGNGEALTLVSKYSELNFGNLKSVSMEAYDDKIVMGNITGNITVLDKYSDLTFGAFENAKLDIYDSDVTTLDGNNVQLKSKYSSFKATSIGDLYFELTYDDDIEVGELQTLRADSKYTNFKIGTLKQSLNLISYDDDLAIGAIQSTFKGLTFEGKYTALRLNIGKEVKYHLEANLAYSKLDYPEEIFDVRIHKEQSEKLEFKGSVKGATDESPKIEVTSYDGDLVIK